MKKNIKKTAFLSGIVTVTLAMLIILFSQNAQAQSTHNPRQQSSNHTTQWKHGGVQSQPGHTARPAPSHRPQHHPMPAPQRHPQAGPHGKPHHACQPVVVVAQPRPSLLERIVDVFR